MLTMHSTCKSWRQKLADVSAPPGTALLLLLACVFTVVTRCLDAPARFFSLETDAVLSGDVYRLFTYVLHHNSLAHVCLSAVMALYPAVLVERSAGTVKFLHQSVLLCSSCGLVHVLLESLVVSGSSRSSVDGLVPLTLALMGTVSVKSALRSAYLMGISVPTAVLPWISLLLVTLFFPGSVFLCDLIAVVTGIFYGKGWLSWLEMSKSRACVLEKKIPFRLLKLIPGVTFISASADSCRKPLDLTNIPVGSYPVQAYTQLSSPANRPYTVDGWTHSPASQAHSYANNHALGLANDSTQSHSHDHAHNHDLGHGHAHSHVKPPFTTTCAADTRLLVEQRPGPPTVMSPMR